MVKHPAGVDHNGTDHHFHSDRREAEYQTCKTILEHCNDSEDPRVQASGAAARDRMRENSRGSSSDEEDSTYLLTYAFNNTKDSDTDPRLRNCLDQLVNELNLCGSYNNPAEFENKQRLIQGYLGESMKNYIPILERTKEWLYGILSESEAHIQSQAQAKSVAQAKSRLESWKAGSADSLKELLEIYKMPRLEATLRHILKVDDNFGNYVVGRCLEYADNLLRLSGYPA